MTTTYDDHDYSLDNLEEAEFGQLHAMHLNMNAVADVRRQLEKQAAQESAKECDDCGDEIPEKRRMVVPGVRLCVHCQTLAERR